MKPSIAIIFYFLLQPAYASLNSIKEIYIQKGNYYVGPVFGVHDYKSHTNVELSSYYIMNTEVTYQVYSDTVQWARTHGYAINDGCNGAIYDECRSPELEVGEQPVTNIGWADTIVFANALSEKLGLTPAYTVDGYSILRDNSQHKFQVNNDADGYRLPTANEWMVAARGGDTGLNNGTYGNYYSGSNNAEEVAWFPSPDSDKFGTAPVGKLKANALGIFDMSGNVYEWIYEKETMLGAEMYYFCGGSYLQQGSLPSCDIHSAGFTMPDIGFRLVRTAAK
ncbi:formylglycine-generating enzyme family protein [Providencia sp. SP181]|uniref:formylglycine-generating enzyme family protein n=1 Tax=Providencia sp. SP181 TaxID=3136277 RepID=UPI003D28E103